MKKLQTICRSYSLIRVFSERLGLAVAVLFAEEAALAVASFQRKVLMTSSEGANNAALSSPAQCDHFAGQLDRETLRSDSDRQPGSLRTRLDLGQTWTDIVLPFSATPKTRRHRATSHRHATHCDHVTTVTPRKRAKERATQGDLGHRPKGRVTTPRTLHARERHARALEAW